jgi:hypothetical protein
VWQRSEVVAIDALRKTVWVATGWDAGGSVRSGATFDGLYCELNEHLAAMTPRLLEQVDIDGCLNERLPLGLLKCFGMSRIPVYLARLAACDSFLASGHRTKAILCLAIIVPSRDAGRGKNCQQARDSVVFHVFARVLSFRRFASVPSTRRPCIDCVQCVITDCARRIQTAERRPKIRPEEKNICRVDVLFVGLFAQAIRSCVRGAPS